jgi:hypothetical protein
MAEPLKRAAEEQAPGGAAKAPKLAASREEFSVCANEALSFRLTHSADGIDDAPQFNPEFTHQVFREDETIWGYRGLEARSPGGLTPCRLRSLAGGAALKLMLLSPHRSA